MFFRSATSTFALAAFVSVLPACAPAPAASAALTVTLPTPPPAPPLRPPPVTAVPCRVPAKVLSIRAPQLDLCGAPESACFGTIQKTSYKEVAVERLTLLPSPPPPATTRVPAAELSLSSHGVTVDAFVTVPQLAVRPGAPRLVHDYFVPDGVELEVAGVHGTEVDLAFAAGEHLRPVEPLTATWPCSALTLDDPRMVRDMLLETFHLSRQGNTLVSTPGPVPVRGRRDGPVVAHIDRERFVFASVVDRAGEDIRAILPIDGGFVLGWVERARFVEPQLGASHRSRPPRVRGGRVHRGVVCPQPVPILVDVEGRTLRVATVHPPIRIDAEHPEYLLGEVFELSPNAKARFPDGALRDCTE